MSSGKGLFNFPGIEAKLQKPTKQSAFEKQRAEAEAKRQREAAETAAVLEDFVKSFDNEDDRGNKSTNLPRPPSQAPIGDQHHAFSASRRKFETWTAKSGPGSLGPPPASFSKKRSFQDFSKESMERGTLKPVGHAAQKPAMACAFKSSDDESLDDQAHRAEEKALARPTLRLSNLPPHTSPSLIRALILSGRLEVESIKMISLLGSEGDERKCGTAIVTLSQGTPANEIDAAVSALQNRYLGYGYYLSLHRHLSSAVTNSAMSSILRSNTTSHPFGAKPMNQAHVDDNTHTQSNLPHEYAPPPSYKLVDVTNKATLLYVPVKPPDDVKTIRLISKAIEGLLDYGPEFEALLMSRPEVQREEKWSWIWDARSDGGIWYRWKLWEIVTGSHTNTNEKYIPLFEGGNAWKLPTKRLTFEYATEMEEFVSDSDYNSSDDDDGVYEDENRERQSGDRDQIYLNPLGKANLTHLLTRLPSTLSKLRKGDIARVTAFAVMHASRGADEVVDLIVLNVVQPFSLRTANLERNTPKKEPQIGTGINESVPADAADASAASLVGLYVVSDILSSSSTSGIRHAWRFRQLFEAALRDLKVFEHLGRLSDKLGWGRLRAEKWKRSVSLILNLWEGWCVFPTETHEQFVSGFENPACVRIENKVDSSTKRGRWKLVEAVQASPSTAGTTERDDTNLAIGVGSNVERQSEVDNITGEPLTEEDVEGEPIFDDDMDEEQIIETGNRDVKAEAVAGMRADDKHSGGGVEGETLLTGHHQSRKRMRAVDMFAHSESDHSD